jgi:hypothetical protein
MWQKWIEDNWVLIHKWSRIWAGEYYGELISELSIFIEKNWQKLEHLSKEDSEKYINKWLKLNCFWQNSLYKKTSIVNNLPEELPIWDEGEESYIEDIIDSDREDIREFLRDVWVNIGGERAIKIIKLREIYLELDLESKVVWDLYFNNRLSMRGMSKKLNIPHSACYKMVSELKEKIISKI